MASKKKTSFEDFYSSIYGERWQPLKKGLLAEPESFSITSHLLKPYYLDKASTAAARALCVQHGDKVLDMCAAPGGKTLLLASELEGSGTLVSNDRSSERRRRLKTVIETHLASGLSKNITVTGYDATRWGLFEQKVYDKILLDAPCSSEEHVLKSPAHLEKWSPARTKQLSIQAHAMLAAAVEALKPSGTIVYSTCALSPAENDGVIEKLLKKRSSFVEIEDIPPGAGFLDGLIADKTNYGIHILPDKNNGWGPIFIARLIKTV